MRGISEQRDAALRPFVRTTVDIEERALHDGLPRSNAERPRNMGLGPGAEVRDELVEVSRAGYRAEPIGLSVPDRDDGQPSTPGVEPCLSRWVHIDVLEVD